MVSSRFQETFPEYYSEDYTKKGRFDLTLGIGRLLNNLEMEIKVANHSIEFYENDSGFVGRDKYNCERRVDLEEASKIFEQKANIIRQGYELGERKDVDGVYNKFLEAAEKLRESVRVRIEYENRMIIESSAGSRILPTPRVSAKQGLFSRLWGLFSRPKERISLQTS